MRGRYLFDVANKRERPIPFYGELGSLNPVIVTAGAASTRGDEVAKGLAASFTMGAGQFCTKPGVVFDTVLAEPIHRFLRPVAHQTVPDALLPEPLQEANPLGIPRRVDGQPT